MVEDFDYGFAENGLTAYKAGKKLASQSFINFVGEERYKTLVNFILHYIADLDIPIKRCEVVSVATIRLALITIIIISSITEVRLLNFAMA